MTEKSPNPGQQETLILTGALQYDIARTALTHTGLRPELVQSLEASLELFRQSGASDEEYTSLLTSFPTADSKRMREDLILSLHTVVGDHEMFTRWQVVAAEALLDVLDPDISG